MSDKPKYEIGQTVYWVESSCNYMKSVPCPICFGHRRVEIILGNKEVQPIECGYCAKGYQGPTGKATIWEPQSTIYEGEITGIKKNDFGKWEYIIGRRDVGELDLYTSKKDAQPKRDMMLETEKEKAEAWFKDSFVRAKKNQVWSVGYHREQIKHHKKSIEWHKMRLQMIKDTPNE